MLPECVCVCVCTCECSGSMSVYILVSCQFQSTARGDQRVCLLQEKPASRKLDDDEGVYGCFVLIHYHVNCAAGHKFCEFYSRFRFGGLTYIG